MSAAEMNSEGGTRSHPRGGLYVFVPCSQFPKGDGGGDGDERVQGHERDRVVEPPCVNRGPAAVEENPHRDPATGGRERGFEKWIRRVAPHFVEIERIDRKSPLRRGEEVEDSLGVE